MARAAPIFMRVTDEAGVITTWICNGPWRYPIHPDRVADALKVWGLTAADVMNASPLYLAQAGGRDVTELLSPAELQSVETAAREGAAAGTDAPDIEEIRTTVDQVVGAHFDEVIPPRPPSDG
jgi:hypothetical protein